jgi:hypothetical protein
MSALAQQSPAASRPDRRESAAGRAGGLSGMLWLTWRQHRWALVSCLVLAVVVVGSLYYVSSDMMSMYKACGAERCTRSSPEGAALYDDFGPVHLAEYLAAAVRYAPLLIGLFIGVPFLAREHEQRTLLLAWSQDASPMRWLWTKLALLGAFVAVVTGAFSIASIHVADTYSTVTGNGMFREQIFLMTGMLPLVSGVCWLVVGVALGAILKRTLPAMFGTIVGFVAATVGVTWRYPTLMEPISFYQRLDEPPLAHFSDADELVIKGNILIGDSSVSNVFDAPGHEVTFADLQRMCPDVKLDNPSVTDHCISDHHLLSHVVYQPGSRIDDFHRIIAGGYLGLAAVALVAVWLIVRRTDLSAG